MSAKQRGKKVGGPRTARGPVDYEALAKEVAELDAAIKATGLFRGSRRSTETSWLTALAEEAVAKHARGKELDRREIDLILYTLLQLGPGSLASIERARRLADEIPGQLRGEKARKVARCVVEAARRGRQRHRADKDALLYLKERIDSATPRDALSRFARAEVLAPRSARHRLRKARTALRDEIKAIGELDLWIVKGGKLEASPEQRRLEALAEALSEI